MSLMPAANEGDAALSDKALPDTALSDTALWLALTYIHGLGGQGFCQLLRAFNDPAGIFAASFSQLRTVVSEPIARAINVGPDREIIAPALQWLQSPSNHIITLADSEYPKSLLE